MTDKYQQAIIYCRVASIKQGKGSGVFYAFTCQQLPSISVGNSN